MKKVRTSPCPQCQALSTWSHLATDGDGRDQVAYRECDRCGHIWDWNKDLTTQQQQQRRIVTEDSDGEVRRLRARLARFARPDLTAGGKRV